MAGDVDRLMARLAQGDREAFSPLFTALWSPALEVCRRLLGSEADAADAAQVAMMKIFERAHEYDATRPALPWALGIAGWEARTFLKRRARQKESPAEVAPVSDEGRAADAFEQQELISSALAALGTLSPTDQETLVATYWERAASSGGATLRKRRERALTRLKDAFRRLYGLG